MRAEIIITLKSAVSSPLLMRALREALGNSAIAADPATADPAKNPFVRQIVGAAMYPDRTRVVFMHTTARQMTVFITGQKIDQMKRHCDNVITQLGSLGMPRITAASATVLIPFDDDDLKIMQGDLLLWLREFKAALREKSVTKVFPSAITAGLAIYYFVPGSQAVTSGLIALVASCVGACAEAGLVTYPPCIWKWKESS